MIDALNDLLSTTITSGIFATMEWAEDEIAAAIKRHPDAADTIWHSFILLTPNHDLMQTEFVYRSHARELLDRVAAGEDTRPGTAAEIAIACSEASLRAPLTTEAAGLYFRMWATAFPDHAIEAGHESLEHYEALKGSRIDDLEAESRRKAACRDRVLDDVTCTGQHNGEPVECRFYDGPPDSLCGQCGLRTARDGCTACSTCAA